ncbi:Uncharacterised protein [Mycobacteroides abscessus subsp. abscessus]|nr:Uncharacterised protein [Mycobacteroides abscessus subsp. abscessus]
MGSTQAQMASRPFSTPTICSWYSASGVNSSTNSRQLPSPDAAHATVECHFW